MTKVFDPTRPVQTRDGREARIICTDRKDTTYPIVALFRCPTISGEREYIGCYRSDGSGLMGQDSSQDLVNIPVKKEGWVNLYPASSALRDVQPGTVHRTEALALDERSTGCIATIRIEWEE